MASTPNAAGLLFVGKRGNRPLALSEINRADLVPIEIAAGLIPDNAVTPKYPCHSLRHFYCSMLIALKYDIKQIQTMMGHSSISMTMDTYGHMMPSPEADRKAMERFQSRLLAG